MPCQQRELAGQMVHEALGHVHHDIEPPVAFDHRVELDAIEALVVRRPVKEERERLGLPSRHGRRHLLVGDLRRAVGELDEAQVARLEQERTVRPSFRVTFEFNATTRAALLHVTNDGSEADVWALMSVEGALSQRVERDLRAVWRPSTRSGQAASSARLQRGQTRTLKLAELDLSVFPYAQWEIYGVPEVPGVPGVLVRRWL